MNLRQLILLFLIALLVAGSFAQPADKEVVQGGSDDQASQTKEKGNRLLQPCQPLCGCWPYC